MSPHVAAWPGGEPAEAKETPLRTENEQTGRESRMAAQRNRDENYAIAEEDSQNKLLPDRQP
jgi:hypothetical protein